MTTPAQRATMLAVMDYLLAHRAAVHYAEQRPMSTRGIASMRSLQIVLKGPAGITIDCSEAVTLICHVAGLADPNGMNYDGNGFTGTLLDHLPHFSEPALAAVGGLVVFGPGDGQHVAMVHGPGPDPMLWSHGQESDPRLIRLGDEAKIHEPPVRFLSIATL